MQNNQIKIFFSTKNDGNLAFHVNDAKQNVINNHKKLAIKHNYEYKNLIHMKQIHSDIVHIVDANDNFDNPPTCDALITNKKNIPLMVMVADCTPVILYDAKKNVIAVAHVGRVGAFKNIIKKTINKMISEYKCDTKDLKVSIGASICKNCYEVGIEIYQEAQKLDLQYAIQIKNDKYYLDVAKIISSQLNDTNIKNNKINTLKDCSICNNKEYYSYRKEGQTGRFAGVIELI